MRVGPRLPLELQGGARGWSWGCLGGHSSGVGVVLGGRVVVGGARVVEACGASNSCRLDHGRLSGASLTLSLLPGVPVCSPSPSRVAPSATRECPLLASHLPRDCLSPEAPCAPLSLLEHPLGGRDLYATVYVCPSHGGPPPWSAPCLCPSVVPAPPLVPFSVCVARTVFPLFFRLCALWGRPLPALVPC